MSPAEIRNIQNSLIRNMIEKVDDMLKGGKRAHLYILKDLGLRECEKVKEFLRSFEE